MDAKNLKEYIYENKHTETILEEVGCKHIKYHPNGNPDAYWTCANPDGNNRMAINLYDKPSLQCINHTRDISQGSNIQTDLFSLVCFIKQLSFNKGLKYICDILGIDYYHNFNDDIPESLKITQLILNMQSNIDETEEKPLKPISDKILSYYLPYVNDMFLKDGIGYNTQKEFGIKYDDFSNRIIIPIYDEIGSLVGVKGRLFKEELDDDDLKYIYLEPCPRNKILYGLYKTYECIKNSGKCYVFEAEKATMQAWSMGICNCVSIGGKEISHSQIEKLTRLGVQIIFAYDKDVQKQEIERIADKFIEGTKIFAIYDEDNILLEKESPTDHEEKFKYLIDKNIYRVK